MSLTKKLIIVNLSISQWSGRKYDAEASKEVDNLHNAYDAGRFNKVLIVSKEFDAISKNANAARRYHNKVTLPWEDGGQRILPIEQYFDYIKELDTFQDKHKALVKEFIDVYEDARKESESKLGTLYKESDYPDANELLSKFRMKYIFTPITDGSDLRVNLSKDELKAVRKNVQDGLNEKINAAKGDIYKRITEVVQKLYDKLNDKNGVFRDTLIHNIEALVEFIPSINFDDDPAITKLIKKLNKLCVSPNSIRTNVQKRAKVKKRAKKLLKQLSANK